MTENPDQYVAKHRHIPDILKVPEGNVLLLRAYGRGGLGGVAIAA